MKSKKKVGAIVLRVAVACLFLGGIVYSGYRIWQINEVYREDKKIRTKLSQYKPDLPPEVPEIIVNQGIVDMQTAYPDTVGWLVVDGTIIDAPFMQARDNEFYLHHDVDGKYSNIGNIFMDYRNSRDFSDFNTFIYGHNVKNSDLMFGPLYKLREKEFFDSNKTARIYLADDILSLEIFAIAIVRPDDRIVYAMKNDTDEKKQALFDHIEQNATNYRDIGLKTTDKIITLSGCAYEFDDARMVVLARFTSAKTQEVHSSDPLS